MIINGLIVFFSLLLLLTFSCLTVSSLNRQDSERSIANYIQVSKKILAEEMSNTIYTPSQAIDNTGSIISSSNSSLRITVITLEGQVIYDSSKDDIEENHLSRPEIKDLGTVYYRYSATLGVNMMYLASLDESSSYYIRLSLPQSSYNQLIDNTMLYGSIIAFGVFMISMVADYFLTKQSLKPLKEEADRLSEIVGHKDGDGFDGNELDSISYQIDCAQKLIQEKIMSVTFEKEKLAYLIDNMSNGLVILSPEFDIVTINKKALAAFDKLDKEPKRLFDLTISNDIVNLCESSTEGLEGKGEFSSDGKSTYLIMANPIKASWCANADKDGVSLYIIDITSSKALEKAKRDFFANASHELKSPLTSIIGYSEMIKTEMIETKKEENEFLDRILSESKRMNQIVIQMLELSRLESDSLISKKENVNLLESSEKARQELEQEAKSNDITVSIKGDGFNYEMDKDDSISLIKNIVENSIRYNRPSGTVDVIFDSAERTITICDTGIGISAQDKDRIFERFYRVDKARSKKLGGTGLGLSIVKHICFNNHISISLDSVINEGTTFVLTFPMNSD